ncbi:Uncharacterised ACR, YkgG family COG1556 [Pustulibacterium marinum]|uniref:Uncharacterized ACR, YkgG family COG1556 n=1 Tax=Pustulibacterium marinum TaxID=1224947 RepID=A0A1I7HNY2_9FLAO|nr:LUD domain-containing protein [Pustulibacterium marinum]SFU62484.1 Uncharacterised ACR, YkgG family COG1556 [Pustulibacterium marinum]
MSLFKRFFGLSKKENENEDSEERGKFMPDEHTPIDELFAINFKNNGGRFIYCDNMTEVFDSFQNILIENSWENENIYCFENKLKESFKNFKVTLSKDNTDAPCFFTTCEYLVADTGALLISSEQIKEKKLNDFPDNFIVLATTSQLVKTISEGLRGIKTKHPNRIPSNITTIKNFEITTEKNFMTYGSSSKNLYLLLLEDL